MKLRNWFRRTSSHNTLTLDEKNLQTTQSVTKLWQPEGNEQILVTENPHYEGLKHRRSVFFVDHLILSLSMRLWEMQKEQ